MKRVILVALLVVVASSLGVGLAAGVGVLARRSFSRVDSPASIRRGWRMMAPGIGSQSGRNYRGMGPGMMGGWNGSSNPSSGPRLTIDQAEKAASDYILNYQSGLKIAEVMEFEENFYAVVSEENTGKGAFEILIDPYSREVYLEPGPNMLWNLKYSHMGQGQGDNQLSMDQASKLAQTYLAKEVPGATVEGDGTAFYGYYTFDYEINGSIAGMLSINGINGAAWLHTWHGRFIAEKEYGK